MLVVGDASDANSTRFTSVPLEFDANPLSFNPVSGYLVLVNTTERFLEAYRRNFPLDDSFPPIVIAELWPGYTRPYIEQKLLLWKERFGSALKGAVIFGGTIIIPLAHTCEYCFLNLATFHTEYAEGGVLWELGAVDQIRVAGVSTKNATYPLIHTQWAAWYNLRQRLLNGSLVNVTITDDGPNRWKALRASFWYPLWMTICTLNIAFLRLRRTHSIGT